LLVGLIGDPYLRELAQRNWQSNYDRRETVSNDFMGLVRPLHFTGQGSAVRHAVAARLAEPAQHGSGPLSPLAMRVAIGDES